MNSASVTVTSTDVTVTVTDVNLNSTNAKQEVEKTDSKPAKTPSKQHTLMSDLCCFFRKHYDFRFNQLTGQTEFARICPEPLYHSRFGEPLSPPAVYRPVIYRTLQRRNPAALRGTTCYTLSRLLPAIGKRVHTKLLNGYWVREV